MSAALTLFTIGMLMLVASLIAHANDPDKPYIVGQLTWKQAIIAGSMFAGATCAVFGGAYVIGTAF